MLVGIKYDLVRLERFKSTQEIQVKVISFSNLFDYRSDTDVTDTSMSTVRQKLEEELKIND